MKPDGSYVQRAATTPEQELGTEQIRMNMAKQHALSQGELQLLE
jgi:hypothetical protein